MSLRKLGVMAIMLGALALFAQTARAQGDDGREKARRHFKTGETLFRSGDYRGAIREFKAADSLVPSPILLYNIGLCHEKLGELDEAVARYKEYVKRLPDAQNAPRVKERIAALEEEMAARNAPLYETLEDEAAPAPAPEPDPSGGLVDDGGALPSGGDGAAARAHRMEDPLARRLPVLPPASGEGALPPAAQGPAEPAGEPPMMAHHEPAGPPAPEKPEDKPTPVYKKWWFWVVVGVSAIILIDIASSGRDSSSNNQAIIAPMTTPDPQGGAILFRF